MDPMDFPDTPPDDSTDDSSGRATDRPTDVTTDPTSGRRRRRLVVRRALVGRGCGVGDPDR